MIERSQNANIFPSIRVVLRIVIQESVKMIENTSVLEFLYT